MGKKFYYDDVATADIIDKDKSLITFKKSMYNKLSELFEYKNLPDTIPKKFLEFYLQRNGQCVVTEVDGKLYAFTGGPGGEPDPYYQPTIYTVANPALNFSAMLKIDKDCVWCRNDPLCLGLDSIINKYGVLIVENLISFRMAAINSRIHTIIDAADDTAKASVDKYLENIEAGKLASIASDDLFGAIHVNPGSSHDKCITDLVELNQYLISQLYAEIGIADNYNMKRERLTQAEAEMIQNKPDISIGSLYKERCLFCDKINEMYGTNIRVKINERWENNANINGIDSGSEDRFVHGHESESRMESGSQTEES